MHRSAHAFLISCDSDGHVVRDAVGEHQRRNGRGQILSEWIAPQRDGFLRQPELPPVDHARESRHRSDAAPQGVGGFQHHAPRPAWTRLGRDRLGSGGPVQGPGPQDPHGAPVYQWITRGELGGMASRCRDIEPVRVRQEELGGVQRDGPPELPRALRQRLDRDDGVLQGQPGGIRKAVQPAV